jgi:hypothetical protein
MAGHVPVPAQTARLSQAPEDCETVAVQDHSHPKIGECQVLAAWIESVNQTRKGQLGLEHHGGRTPAGVFNWTTGVTSKRSLIAYDH